MTLLEKLLAAPLWQEPDAGGAAGGEIKEPVAPPPGDGGEAPPPADRDDGDVEDDGLLGSGSDDDRKVVIPADWPEDWRTKLAGEDDKISKRLERFKSPQDLMKSWLAAEQKISSGEYRKNPADAENDEEAAELRKQMGIPDAPDAYELPETFQALELDPNDEGLAKFREAVHAKGLNQEQFQTALQAYDELLIDAQQKQVEADQQYRMQNEDALRAEWGNEFRPRVELLKRMAQDEEGPVAPSVMRALATARDADGNRVFNNKEVAEWLVSLGMNHYGDGALLTGEQQQMQSNRIEEIRGVMKTDFDKYYNEVQPNGKTMAQEYAEYMQRQENRR